MNQLQREYAEALDAPAAASDGTTTALQLELSKWRERVPPLVAALRERTEQVERLQAEVAGLREDRHPGAGGQDNPGVRARDAIIQELESELATLRDAHARARGDLHARDVAIDGLQRDLRGWKTKWQSLAERLDAPPPVDPETQRRLDGLRQANVELDRQLAALRERLAEMEVERDQLQARNASLFETTGLANRQLETLAADLGTLRGELKVLRGECSAVAAAREALEAARAAAVADAAQLEQECALLCAAALDRVAHDGAVAARLGEMEAQQVETARTLLRSAARIKSLEDALTAAREAGQEAAALGESLAAERQRVLRLEGKLQERSALVMSLEAEHEEQRRSLAAAATEATTLRAALDRAEGQARAHADYITQLDDRLDRQKALLLGLEEELARTRADHIAVVREHEATVAQREVELRALRLQLTGLQGLLKEQSAAAGPAPEAAEHGDAAARASRDSQTLRVLNQQLLDARARNNALRARVRELEAAAPGAASGGADELTRIHGVGPRLAEHLRSLGVCTLAEVAALDASALDDPAHRLAPLKARILRDRWIEQAAALRPR